MTKIYENEQMNSDFLLADSILNVNGAYYVNDDVASIKYAIDLNGAVVAALDTSTSNYFGIDSNNDYNYYRASNYIPATHAVILVGWDDNYSRYNFGSSIPDSDGAWLVKNSKNDHQYFWLSYEEGSLSDNLMTISGVEKASKSEKMLSYDYYPVAYSQNVVNSEFYMCNVFDVSYYASTYDQINKVMFYLRNETDGCTYEIKICQLNDSGDLPSNLNNYLTLASGEFKGEGYITADLDVPYTFTSDNDCAVIVKVIPKSPNSQIYIPYEGDFDTKEHGVTLQAQINSGESFYGFTAENNNIVWSDCYDENQYNISGNLVVRPVLNDSDYSQASVSISPSEVSVCDNDVNITISGNTSLFSIHTPSNIVLREDIDYVRTNDGIILKGDYLNSLGDNYTMLVFEFNDNLTRNLIINPKSTLTQINLIGNPIAGDTLTAECVGIPERDDYDVSYQWQISPNGISWYDITNANSNTYTITENEYNLYIRVKVTSSSTFGNVVYPLEITSPSTPYKVVILGDVDFNGIVRTDDATLVNKYLVGLATLNDRQLLAADANRDGVVNISDVTRIQQIAV